MLPQTLKCQASLHNSNGQPCQARVTRGLTDIILRQWRCPISLTTAFQPKGLFGLLHDFGAGWNTKSVYFSTSRLSFSKGIGTHSFIKYLFSIHSRADTEYTEVSRGKKKTNPHRTYEFRGEERINKYTNR